MYSASDLKKGLKIEIDGDPCIITDFQFAVEVDDILYQFFWDACFVLLLDPAHLVDKGAVPIQGVHLLETGHQFFVGPLIVLGYREPGQKIFALFGVSCAHAQAAPAVVFGFLDDSGADGVEVNVRRADQFGLAFFDDDAFETIAPEVAFSIIIIIVPPTEDLLHLLDEAGDGAEAFSEALDAVIVVGDQVAVGLIGARGVFGDVGIDGFVSLQEFFF